MNFLMTFLACLLAIILAEIVVMLFGNAIEKKKKEPLETENSELKGIIELYEKDLREAKQEMEQSERESQEDEATEMFIKNCAALQRHIYNNCTEFLIESEKIFVSFRFNQTTYDSDIVLTGRTYNEDGSIYFSQEKLIRTPRIPLIGGCWSNVVATKMLSGQTFVSTMLENTANAIKYMQYYDDDIIRRRNNTPLVVIKVDRCLYAPFLYFITNENELKNDDLSRRRR